MGKYGVGKYMSKRGVIKATVASARELFSRDMLIAMRMVITEKQLRYLLLHSSDMPRSEIQKITGVSKECVSLMSSNAWKKLNSPKGKSIIRKRFPHLEPLHDDNATVVDDRLMFTDRVITKKNLQCNAKEKFNVDVVRQHHPKMLAAQKSRWQRYRAA